jgi:hypothetical protein
MKVLGVDDKIGVGCGGGAFFIHILTKTLKIRTNKKKFKSP